MRLENINRLRVASVMVRGFFHGFFAGQADALHPDTRKLSPKELKQIVSAHYEKLSNYFVSIMFPILIRLNFDDLEAVTADMKKRHFSNNTSPKLLLRYACGSKEAYEIVTEEYKRQMYHLLEGKLQTTKDYLNDCQLLTDTDAVAVPLAIRSLVRVQMQAYALGMNLSESALKTMHQTTIYRLMIQGMNVLLHEDEVVFDDENLEMMFRKVALNSTNFETLMNEMNEAYEDLSKS